MKRRNFIDPRRHREGEVADFMENLKGNFSWSRFHSFRREIRKSFPSVYGLAIKKKIFDVIAEEMRDGGKILDVGASVTLLREKIMKRFPSAVYKTMDIDRAQHHDYYDLADISETFDLIVLSEVIEHLEFQEGMSMLGRLLELLSDGGRMIVSTPNLHHPHRYWDSDHKTPYRYDEISGALLSAGFNVENIYRIYNDRFLKWFFRIHVASHLHRYLDIDFAKSIIVVARKK